MMKIKKIVSVFLIISTVIVGLVPRTSVQADNTNVAKIEVYEMLSQIALDWVYNFNGETDCTVNEIVEIFDTSGELYGFNVTISRFGTNYGYLVYNTRKNKISEFYFSDKTEGLYDVILDELDEKSIQPLSEKKLYTDNGLEYFVELNDLKKNEKILYSNYGKTDLLSDNLYSSTNKFNAWEDILEDIADFDSSTSYQKISSNRLIQRAYIYEGYVEQYCKKYACAVVAMLNVCAQEGYFNYRNSGNHQLNASTIVPAFEYLWDASDTIKIKESNGISYGSTLDSMISIGIKRFAANYTNEFISTTTTTNPDYSVFTNAVDNQKSSVLTMHIYCKNNSGVYEESGHSVSVTGYAKYKKNSTSEYMCFLKIADGWSDHARYLDYDEDNFIYTQSVVVN